MKAQHLERSRVERNARGDRRIVKEEGERNRQLEKTERNKDTNNVMTKSKEKANSLQQSLFVHAASCT